MSVEQVMSTFKEHELNFIDLRFTDTKGKEQHVTIPAPVKKEEVYDFFEEGKMFDGALLNK